MQDYDRDFIKRAGAAHGFRLVCVLGTECGPVTRPILLRFHLATSLPALVVVLPAANRSVDRSSELGAIRLLQNQLVVQFVCDSPALAVTFLISPVIRSVPPTELSIRMASLRDAIAVANSWQSHDLSLKFLIWKYLRFVPYVAFLFRPPSLSVGFFCLRLSVIDVILLECGRAAISRKS